MRSAPAVDLGGGAEEGPVLVPFQGSVELGEQVGGGGLLFHEAAEDDEAAGAEFAHFLTDRERLPYTLAIHRGGGENPHCHL